MLPSNDFQQNMAAIIAHCEATTPDDWCEDVVRSKDSTKNCLLGHVFGMGDNDKEGNAWWMWFENRVASTYMVYPVNDKQHPKYQQDTPKERCIAYLKDLRDGKEKTTKDHFDDYDALQKQEGYIA